jgi:hypothetical protein
LRVSAGSLLLRQPGPRARNSHGNMP